MDLKNFFKRSFIAHIAVFLLFFCAPSFAVAASLKLLPSSGTYVVGEEFFVSVRLDAGNNFINAAEGLLVFDPAKIEIMGFSLSGSIFHSWTTEPEFSNEAGTVRFAGTVATGFSGEKGKIFDMRVKAKRPEAARLNFSSAAVLASDGSGSNVLEEMINGTYTFVPRTLSPEPERFMSSEGAPWAPEIQSPTHPDELSWYSDNEVVVQWDTPAGVDAVRTVLGEDPNLVPAVQYSPPINERNFGDLNLGDGTWYFRAQFRNSFGWGEIGTFAVNIDTKPPESFAMTRVGGEDPTDPIIYLVMEAYDEISGIDRYEIRINGHDPIVWHESEGGIGPLPPGEKFILAKAIDRAGNYLLDSKEIEIKPLDAPVINHYPSLLSRGEALVVQGFTQPSSEVIFWLKKGNENPVSYKVKSREDGFFTFVNEDEMSDGVYTMWVEATDKRGAKSLPEGDFKVVVSPPRILVVGSFVIDYLAVVVPLVATVFLLFFVVVYGYGRAKTLRNRVKKDIEVAEEDLHNAFLTLKKEVEKQIDLIEKADSEAALHDRERKAVINLKKSLIKAERRISKDISDIKKDVE